MSRGWQRCVEWGIKQNGRIFDDHELGSITNRRRTRLPTLLAKHSETNSIVLWELCPSTRRSIHWSGLSLGIQVRHYKIERRGFLWFCLRCITLQPKEGLIIVFPAPWSVPICCPSNFMLEPSLLKCLALQQDCTVLGSPSGINTLNNSDKFTTTICTSS